MSGAKSKLKNTRSSVVCEIFGAPSDFSENVLPTTGDVLKCYLHVRQSLKQERNGQDASISEISQVVTSKVEAIWNKASIPIVSHRRVVEMLTKTYNDYRKIVGYPKTKRNENYTRKVEDFKKKALSELFDIGACKHQLSSECNCEKSKKVPPKEQAFINDQRTLRKMVIGNVDQVETDKLRKREDRKNREKMRLEKEKLNTLIPQTAEISSDSENSTGGSSTNASTEELAVVQPSTSTPKAQSQMRLSLPTVSRVSDQYGISDRSAAAIASATLQDAGIITKGDTSQVIDRSKVRRERKKSRIAFRNASANDSERCIESIFFDGRKDKTLHQEKIGERFHRRTITEEHISLVEEPNSLYLGHVTPSSGTGKHIAESILTYCTENGLSFDNVKAVGCDGTAVNTGCKNGAIRYLENQLGHPLQWLICLLHANELPLRHLFAHLDGETTGPRAFSGLIGKALVNCEIRPVVNFETLPCDLPNIDVATLSTDQKYLYEICDAISSGQCSINLARSNPGKMSHSRWLTTANRIIRLYIGSENPSQNLRILAEYVTRVYAPMWFQIKVNSSCTNGARNVFRIIELSRYLSSELLNVVRPVIQRNAFFCHPENILLAMITDKRRHVRELAFRRIINARKSRTTKIREFQVPLLNFSAIDYIDVITWQNCEVTSPPILQNVTTEELTEIINSQDIPSFQFPKFPCHTQAVERCVKMVTEASLSVVGNEARDGFIRAKIESRLIMPSFETKGQFNVK